MSTLLVVEDSDVIRHSVVAALRAQGHRVKGLPDGTELESAINQLQPEVIVLDVMLPGGRDGFELLKVVRRQSRAGVVMLTARDDLESRVRGLSGGADDYLAKPFAMVELTARVEALLRRTGAAGSSVTVGDLVVKDDAALVTRNGVTVELTETERKLLAQLAKHPDRVVSKTQLLTAVWGYNGYDENIVEVHISSLRRRLEAHGPRVIHTLRGRGYRLGEQ
ncbi:response regulator transcription factor [Aestuariimicrobium ganziense]|uniref:response regulator transcription factor n=1 Tax=Aestuariimicrobium ganziense TaxID=2773677 RepID=UPI001942A693|nr:response regulator transcription factor [Aestuariimicrobium ganziense]